VWAGIGGLVRAAAWSSFDGVVLLGIGLAGMAASCRSGTRAALALALVSARRTALAAAVGIFAVTRLPG
jgi:hypothetical protein